MENRLTEKESLELIGKMISSAKDNLQKGTGKVFLLWGYLTLVTALANLVLFSILPDPARHYAFLVWFMMPAGIVFHVRLIRKIAEGARVTTYIDQILSYVWIGFSVSIQALVAANLVASFIGAGGDAGSFSLFRWFNWLFLIPFMLILYGFALFVSGKAYRFGPMVAGSIVCWVLTVVIFAFYSSPYLMEIELIALVIAVLAGYIIPGHLLANKERGHVQ